MWPAPSRSSRSGRLYLPRLDLTSVASSQSDQSVPRQYTYAAALERRPSSRHRSGQGGGTPRKMIRRSSSHISVLAAMGGYGYGYVYQHAQPWAGVMLDQSSVSVVGSECRSTSSVVTAATVGYCCSLVGFEARYTGSHDFLQSEPRNLVLVHALMTISVSWLSCCRCSVASSETAAN